MAKKPRMSAEEARAIRLLVAAMFLKQPKPGLKAIRGCVAKRPHRWSPSNQQIYDELRAAAAEGMLRLVAPRLEKLALEVDVLALRHGLHGSAVVVEDAGKETAQVVADTCADEALLLLREAAGTRRDRSVHLGLGLGLTCTRVAHRLALRLADDVEIGRLHLHAVSPPYGAWDPLENPLSSFGLLRQRLGNRVEFVGLWTEPVVSTVDYARVVANPVVADAKTKAMEIDVLVTSMASSEDRDGTLRQYIKTSMSPTAEQALVRSGWVGDVQLQPFSATGPIEIDYGIRPIALMTLAEWVAWKAANPSRHVVLACGPCTRCGGTKEKALLPLLTRKELKLWDRLVLDRKTAEEVVKLDRTSRLAKHVR